MNSTEYQSKHRDNFQEAFVKNIVIVSLGILINCINGMLMVTHIRNSIFHNNPRYVLYFHLVVNDMLMISLSVSLYVLSYAWPFVNFSACCVVLIIGSTTTNNTPLNLAVMAIERYIAIRRPLHHSQICTVHKTYIVISLIWIVGVIPGLTSVILVFFTRPMSVFNTNILCMPAVAFNTKYHIDQTMAVQIIFMSIVWLALIYTYIGVLMIAKKASTDSSAKKAQNTILLHGAQLLLCMMSYLLPVLDLILIPFFPSHRSKITFFNYLITNIIPRLLSSLIYGVRDPKYAKYMRMYYSCKLVIVKIGPT